jgi:putative ABC transport system substrate-binding protein
MRRRDFITLLGGTAAAWPVAAWAQQQAVPLIGYLDPSLPETVVDELAALRRGLSETGYIEGRNITIEYRWAHNDLDRMPELTADLIRRHVAVIVADGSAAALRAKTLTTTIPIVFWSAADAVEAGLVESLSRPGGNLTGVNTLNVGLGAKRFELLHELAPQAMHFGLLVNPVLPGSATIITEAQAAAASLGQPLDVIAARSNGELDQALASIVEKQIDALVVGPAAFFVTRRVQLTTFAARHALPVIFNGRTYTDIGGLMSYGPNTAESWRQVGIYVGRILKGEKPADLPVVQPTKFELVVNLQTARLLGIPVPSTLLAIADEVIE